MSRIGEYFVKLQNHLSSHASESPHQTVSFEKAKYIGILFLVQEGEHSEYLNQFVDKLHKMGKKLKLLTYLDKLGSSPYTFSYEVFTHKDLSTLGKIKSPAVAEFIAARFDYLYCIHLEPFPIFEQIMRGSQAKCRVGPYFSGQEDLYDIMISLPESSSLKMLMDEMLFYTKSLTEN